MRYFDPVTNIDQNVVDIRFDNSADLEPVVDKEPVLCLRSVTYKFVHRMYLEEKVMHTIENINIVHGDSDGE